MNKQKPKHVDDDIWKQHLVWLEVMRLEADTNAIKRQQAPRKNGRLINY